MALSSEGLKDIGCRAIDGAAEELNSISQDIWNNPELCYEERHAHNVLAEFLERTGFSVERSHVLETAFRATVGTGEEEKEEGHGTRPSAAVICEYDALPGIGHGCGHNLIAEVGVGAALGIKAALDASKDAGKPLGRLLVLGTPAEEGGGGKCQLIKAGCFEGVDLAMMAHPGSASMSVPDHALVCRLAGRIAYHGKASHAAAFPWEGVNALDAAVLAYNNISVLRQQMKPTWRVHAIISEGGVKPNIIPEKTELLCYVRSPTRSELDVLCKKVTGCFEAAATATGCTVDVQWNTEAVYLNMLTNKALAELYDKNAAITGVQTSPNSNQPQIVASTDMGNVSYEVPSLHPMFYVGSDEALHTRAFTAAAGDQAAQSYTITQAKTLAMTAIDVFCQPELLPKMKEQFVQQKQMQ